jgi:hypothetical protein
MLPYTEMTKQGRAAYEQEILAELRQLFPTAYLVPCTHPEQSIRFHVSLSDVGTATFWPPRLRNSAADLWACSMSALRAYPSATGAGATAADAYKTAAKSMARTIQSLTTLLEAAASAEAV